MKYSSTFSVLQGLHPRVVTEGLNESKKKALEVLESMKIPIPATEKKRLFNVATTSLYTKVHGKIASILSEVKFCSLFLQFAFV